MYIPSFIWWAYIQILVGNTLGIPPYPGTFKVKKNLPEVPDLQHCPQFFVEVVFLHKPH